MKFGLDQPTITLINTVFQQYPEIRQVIIYGSRAKGNFRQGSDIDLTIKGNNLTNQLLSEVISDLKDLNTPYLFDLSILGNLNSSDLEDHIARIGKVFYEKSN